MKANASRSGATAAKGAPRWPPCAGTCRALRWPCCARSPRPASAERDPALYIFTEDVTAELLARFDVVIKSPGISPYHGAAAQALARGVPSPPAARCGSVKPGCPQLLRHRHQKSTTTALIAHLLRASGARTALAGNIGLPLLELLDTDPAPDVWASNCQLPDPRRDCSGSRGGAEPVSEHLDWHGSEDRYVIDSWRWSLPANRAISCSTPPIRLAVQGSAAPRAPLRNPI